MALALGTDGATDTGVLAIPGSTPLITSSSPETFSTIDAFLAQLAREVPSPNGGMLNFLIPETMIAGGTGIRCRYAPEFGDGVADVIRPFAGALFIFYAGRYVRPDLINEIAQQIIPSKDRYMIRMVLDGDVSMRIGDDTQEIRRGDAVVYQYKDTLDFELITRAQQHHRYIHMIFTPDGLENAARDLQIRVPDFLADDESVRVASAPPTFKVKERALEHFAESFWLYTGPDDLRGQLVKLKVGELFCLLGSSRPEPHTLKGVSLPHREVRKLITARKTLDEKFTRPPSLNRLATDVGLNRRKLTEGFRALYGMSVGEYCRHRRTELACDLLAQSDLPIRLIAEKCGYEHVANFSRAFTAQHGISPSSFRVSR